MEIWTKKEAILKAVGTGIIFSSWKNIILSKNYGILNNREKWYLKKIELDFNYIIYLATNQTKINLKKISVNI